LLGQFKFDDYLESRYNPESLRIRRLRDDLLNNQFNNLLPDRPFKSTDKSSDYNVAIKRALIEAANGDYDRLYLTTGQQQADRYDLSKQINEVRLGGNEAAGYTVSAFDKSDAPVIMETIKSLDELPALIGKDAAKAIVDQPFTNTAGFGTYNQKILAGQDLSIGGEGMKQFYDKTYRNALAKMVKPYGVKVGQSTLDSGPERFTEMFEEFQRLKHARDNNNFMSAADKKLLSKIEEEGLKPVDFGDTVYSVDITPKMREDFKNGIPMFAGGGAVDTTDIFEYNLGGSVSQMMRDPDEERAAGPTGPQAASFAMNLPPGAGLTDAFGYMPQLPGSEAGYEDIFDQPNYPSMAANIGQGDYLDAGFQGLGVLGDLATAVPFVGPALGALIKTPGALRKASKLSKLKDSSTGGIDSLPQEILRVGDGVDSIDAARIVSAKAGLSKKQTITALENQFISEHPNVGELTLISGKPGTVTEKLIRSRAKKYVKTMESVPAVYRREAYRLDTNLERIGTEGRKILHPEFLIGKTGVPTVGDRTQTIMGPDKAGRGIMSIRGVPLREELLPHGGFGFSAENIDDGKGWASMFTLADKKQGNYRYAAEKADSDDIIAIYSAMGKDAMMFTTDTLMAMMDQLPAIRVAKKDIKEFDDAIRKGSRTVNKKTGKVTDTSRPEWLGLEHPDVYDQLLGKGEFSRGGAGALRIDILTKMRQPKFEDRGFPIFDDAVDSIIAPELSNYGNIGESGLSMFKADVSEGAKVFPELNHPSYDTAIPGQYVGGLEGSLPPEIMYPDMFKFLSQKLDKNNVPLSRGFQTGSLTMDPKLFETYTPEKVENIIKYMNKNLGTDYAEGGEVSAEDQVDIFDV